VLPQSFSLGRQFLPRRRPIADTPASLRPAPCPMPPAPRIPAGRERITGLPKGHSMLLMRITNVERVSRPVHRSVGPGDPTYTTVVVLLVCVSETHRRKLLMPPSSVGCNTKCQWLGINW
jgi:hypothetical protein